VPLTHGEAHTVLVWRPDSPNPALPALRELVRDVARTTDFMAAG
jgi:hypothetical protein